MKGSDSEGWVFDWGWGQGCELGRKKNGKNDGRMREMQIKFSRVGYWQLG